MLLHTAHLHTHVSSLNNYHHTQRFECLLDTFFDLECHTLLYLESVAVNIHHTGYLGESCDVAVGDIGHVYLAVEGNHVVFAEREEVDVLNDDHLGVVFFEERLSQNFMGVHAVAACEYLHRFRHPHRCLLQTIAVRILAKKCQDVAVVLCKLLKSFSVFCFRIHFVKGLLIQRKTGRVL